MTGTDREQEAHGIADHPCAVCAALRVVSVDGARFVDAPINPEQCQLLPPR